MSDLTPAQQQQQNNRTSDGKYTTKQHSEAEVDLGIAQGYQPEDHIDLGDRLVHSLREATNDLPGDWYVEHNEESQVSYVTMLEESYDSQGPDLRFSIGAEDLLTPGSITIDCESPEDLSDLAGPHATEGEMGSQLVSEARSSYSTKNFDDAVEWAKGKVRARQINDGYAARYDDRSDALDTLARSEGKHIVSAVQQQVETSNTAGVIAAGEQGFNYQEIPDDVFRNATALYSNMQQHHFGVGASNADELRSAYIVSATRDDDGNERFVVGHAYGVHSETEAEDGYRTLATVNDRQKAKDIAKQNAQQEIDSGSIAYANRDTSDFWSEYQNGHVMALDANHPDGMIVLRTPDQIMADRHQIN